MTNPNTAYRTAGQKPVQPVPPATIQQMRLVQPSPADPPQKPHYMVRPPGGKKPKIGLRQRAKSLIMI